jgi:type III secretion protein C
MSSCSRATFLAVGLVLLGEGAPVAVRAAPIDWRNLSYDYVVLNQAVADVLTNFGYNTGLRMSIASDIKGTVHGRVNASTAVEFLDALTKSNGLDWYYDGSVMYVSPASSEQTAAVPLQGASFDSIKAFLDRSGLTDQRYVLSGDSSASSVTVSGPPSYVAVVKQAIEAQAGKDSSVAIYRGSQSASVKFP